MLAAAGAPVAILGRDEILRRAAARTAAGTRVGHIYLRYHAKLVWGDTADTGQKALQISHGLLSFKIQRQMKSTISQRLI